MCVCVVLLTTTTKYSVVVVIFTNQQHHKLLLLLKRYLDDCAVLCCAVHQKVSLSRDLQKNTLSGVHQQQHRRPLLLPPNDSHSNTHTLHKVKVAEGPSKGLSSEWVRLLFFLSNFESFSFTLSIFPLQRTALKRERERERAGGERNRKRKPSLAFQLYFLGQWLWSATHWQAHGQQQHNGTAAEVEVRERRKVRRLDRNSNTAENSPRRQRSVCLFACLPAEQQDRQVK